MKTPSPDEVLRVVGVTLEVAGRGGRRRLVERVDLEVARCETVAVVGRSGSGKSTLLNVMGLLAEPAAGEVWICGSRRDHASTRSRDVARAHEIGFVFQTMNLVPHLTVVENIALGAPASRIGRTDALGLLELVGLAEFADRRAQHLSLGEQQRVAVTRALAKKPRLVLADEPTGSLDAESEAAVLRLLSGAASAGSAVVLVTHSPVVASWADRVVELEAGLLHERSRA